ncbi:hypothetical protein NG701_07585 [Pseudarthrobacter sp. HLT3-5]|uniref:hypothetical protein n=1 Tax=Pseudarthrobacter cellobiosi TaxID=2953654 RepID=UPI00208FA2B2|nr:hypothetical protein [Pseudarthrobacter sp. HLT3-5]MCO4274290.1 hypothetical protein [Pseudarthrobacter sp. HLT3-5]
MTKSIEFKKVTKVKGLAMAPLFLRVDPIDKVVIQEFAERQTETSGHLVSAGNVLVTSFYQQFRDEHQKKLRLEKEVVHGRRYIDGIKRQ